MPLVGIVLFWLGRVGEMRTEMILQKKARLWYNLGVIKKGKQNEKIIYDIALFNRFVWL